MFVIGGFVATAQSDDPSRSHPRAHVNPACPIGDVHTVKVELAALAVTDDAVPTVLVKDGDNALKVHEAKTR